MSLAPANSRGAFLKARLAVNGIQCAARSLGTLTAGERGLLSSMAGLFEFSVGRVAQYVRIFAQVLECQSRTFSVQLEAVNRRAYADLQGRKRRSRTPRRSNLPCRATEIRRADRPSPAFRGSGRSRRAARRRWSGVFGPHPGCV